MFSRLTYVGKVILPMIAACGMIVCAPHQGTTQASLEHTYDWVVEIETQKMDSYLDFPGSQLTPAIRAAITYAKNSGEGDSSETCKYEDLYYGHHATIGLRRFQKLPFHDGEQVAIVVKDKDDYISADDGRAAANALLRVFLDAYAQGSATTEIKIPDQSLPHIVGALGQLGFCIGPEDTPDVPVSSSVQLTLDCYPSGHKQNVIFGASTD